MSFLYKLFLVILFLYLCLCLYLTYYIKKSTDKYYDPVYVYKTKEDEENKKKSNLQDVFDEFSRKDKKLSFMRIFLGIVFLTWVRLIGAVLCAAFLKNEMKARLELIKKNNNQYTKDDVDYIKARTSFWSKIFLTISCIMIDFHKVEKTKIEQIYKKYFGDNYKIRYDGQIGGYISNHVSFIDILLAMRYFGAGFISKESVKDVPIVGKIAEGLQSIFVERDNPNSRKEVLLNTCKRQKDFYENKPVIPITIFPEGTTTSGRTILQFKRGAFYSELPMKPVIIKSNLDDHFHISCGSTNTGINYIRGLTQFYTKVEYIELPIVEPTEYMYQNYKSFGKENWEIYANVLREIYAEIGGFTKSNSCLRDSYRYDLCIRKKKFYSIEEYEELMKKNNEKFV